MTQFAWDGENRLVAPAAQDSSGNWVTYSYDPWGKRVMQYATGGRASTVSTCALYFYGVNGKRLGTYNCCYNNGQFTISTANINVYFGKKLIPAAARRTELSLHRPIRLSPRPGLRRNVAYYPWGEERTSTPNGTEKFGTYFRDGYGQDYADQRYYTAVFGRFWTRIVGYRAANPKNPISWNLFAYVNGDPTNFMDRHGLGDDDDDDDDDDERPCTEAIPGAPPNPMEGCVFNPVGPNPGPPPPRDPQPCGNANAQAFVATN